MADNRIADVLIVRHPEGQQASEPQIDWAVGHLTKILQEKGLTVTSSDEKSAGGDARLQIIIPGKGTTTADIPDVPEAFGVFAETHEKLNTLVVAGADTRGLIYAVLELADIAKHSSTPLADLKSVQTFVEKPSNSIRSVTRLFSSEAEDKSWFYDRSFWDEYLTELATQRFNRITLGTGVGYDYLIDKIVMDTYFCFMYPFLISVPGYSVQVDGLSVEERTKNLETLQYISGQAKLRGLQFRLGLWNHAYDYGPNNTNKKYKIEGLDGSNHASYCRDALKYLLQTCTDIQGITFRVHFEGGVPEPTHDFWRVVVQGIEASGRQIEVDFHAKGVNDELIDIAISTGGPVVLSTKYWAEHAGLPYHQASIREREFYPKRPGDNKTAAHSSIGNPEIRRGGMEVTSKRSYTRYGYADYYRDDRKYGIVHRVWPGTQRILMWGDPAMAAGYGRYASFCGSLGIEWFEPLSFKGRKGSGSPGGRELYADEQLQLFNRDWTKFSYTYRLLGRLSYNPDTNPDSWRRYLRTEFQGAAEASEESLAYASRILPLILVAHAPSVANNVYWPEMYTNMPLYRDEKPINNPYSNYGYPYNYDFDTPSPHTFGSASPLDPVLVYSVNEFADDILQGKRKGKYTPLEIADILDDLADKSERRLEEASGKIPNRNETSFRRMEADVKVMMWIGRFFARKFRAGLAYALFERASDASLLQEALDYYYEARDAWKQVIDASKGIYKDDITFGRAHYSRGHWADRLAAIDEDISALERMLDPIRSQKSERSRSMSDLLSSFTKGVRPELKHSPVSYCYKGEPIHIQTGFTERQTDIHVQLHYRHVNQAEPYVTVDMEQNETGYFATIPAAYTDSPYPLQYFFEVRSVNGDAWLMPGFADDLSNQPYYVLHPQASR
ncbi:hypothetical protein [Paenibacillus cremeus]|uniref:Alpha glucuronidase N-terminal domain-containing protein n=1 Tax=Paenibacillus cremeus TaxID=2163881 RepID=A0A559K7B1_9BACL|nr:hypothetical protein [Paenibacillus cremeus]TVY08004.1 hypothetical protein FPZ49_21385 [Paenibacillus cremeus]